MRALLVIALVAGCASFEDPTIVLDLRVIAMQTDPPEQVLDIDPDDPPTFDEILAQMQPITVRAVMAEPGRNGPIAWTLQACILEERGSRCEGVGIDFAGDVLGDPETNDFGNPCPNGFFEPGGTICGTLVPDNRIVQLLYTALQNDPTRGLGGIDLGIVLRAQAIDGVNTTPIAEAFAAKHVRFVARVPDERKPNRNPNIDQLLIGQNGFGVDLRKRHCADAGTSFDVVDQGDRVTLFPVSREGDKETYVVPTLDGQSQQFTESLTYQWVATAGSFSEEETGGPPDVFGNVKLDGTEWTAPTDLTGTVTVWVIQRDPRYGVQWREGCIMVVEP